VSCGDSRTAAQPTRAGNSTATVIRASAGVPRLSACARTARGFAAGRRAGGP
jgi:hypothetical protein